MKIGRQGLAQDIRHALRGLARRPGFTVVTVLTLGLGIGATTAIFSTVRTVLLRELPYPNHQRVVTLLQTDTRTGERTEGVSAANIQDLDESATRLGPVSVAEPWSLDLLLSDRAETLRAWAVSRGFFQVLGAEALLGWWWASFPSRSDSPTGRRRGSHGRPGHGTVRAVAPTS